MLILISLSDAKSNGLTPFSVYQGKWNVAFRDMEAEIIPMCEDQGLAIIPWAALGGGRLKTSEQRKKDASSSTARSERGLTDKDLKVSEVLEKIAVSKDTTLQAVVSFTGVTNLLIPTDA
jgi:aryl-alcohol dehydrogenase-like predicted oxidoreductase